MFHRILLATVVAVSLAAPASAQLFYRDLFTTNGNLQGRGPSSGVGGTYTATVPTNASATTTGGTLVLANTSSTNNNVFGAATLGGGFSTLASLPRWIEWRFNMRLSLAPTGFGGTQFGSAVILAANNTNLDNGSAAGWALTYTNNGAASAFQLVRFAAGMTGTLTSVVASGNNPISPATDFASIRVTYNPVGNNWQLFFRDDGGSAVDPYTGGAYTLAGTASSSVNTGAGINQTGFYYSYGSGSQTATFDNFTVAAVPEPTTWALIGLGVTGLAGGIYRYRRNSKKLLNSEVDVEASEVA